MSDMLVDCEIRPITAEEYDAMAKAGILGDEERVELLEGQLVRMSALGDPHWLRHGKIVHYLDRVVGDLANVFGASSLRLNDINKPQPDVAILDPLVAREKRQPTWAEVYALIEISDTSIRKDTTVKRDIYARCSVPDYLVVDINADKMLYFCEPHDGEYPTPSELRTGDTFRLERLPDVTLRAAEFLE